MSTNYCIGIDIGTTSTKAVLFSEKGQGFARHSVEYPLHTPTPSTAEQDPEEIYKAVLEVLKQVTRKSGIEPERIAFVSFSSAMHSVIAMDGSHRPLTRCITWADNRSTKWADYIKKEQNGHEIYRCTGTPIHPMSPLAKIVWIREEHPEIFKRTAKFISIKEYVFYRLFKQYIADYSIASATGLFNLEYLSWDKQALNVAGITKEQLSVPVPTTHAVQGMDAWAAKEIGLNPDTPFIVGASDGVLSNLGVGAVEPGVVAVTIGTSGAIRTVVEKPVTDPKGRIFCYALTDKHWVIGGPVNNGGMTLRWVRDELAASEIETAKRLGISSYDVLTKIASNVRPGCDGLLFHPYLAGERAPLWNANARGSFFGLSLHHKKEHMIRAVLEGVIYNLYTVFLALKELIPMPKQIQATGGFARSALWRQMMADIFDQDVYVPEDYESSCLGAMVLGLYALGRTDSLEVVSEMVGATHHHTPNPEHVAVYAELLPIYLRIMRKLEDEYESIAEFQRKALG
ncbi:gluconokinase [Aneurinibacillus aneurinilyticus]|uniref:Gluconokinase n=2 Tax=Aneurinibacillus aneurinilyticus TaxID=1391 RepID=A0A848D1Z6_ANEAE|nr:gluconokinase [Aneurinibacillus aneurinilyticus]ERI10622.1 gluconokinase [Aneurinibacillus aneurinilyticus ATCC 12856]MED0708042.1 gluconokinase [Aneurinibacillus aneurinilyticus]MED0722151.1 gluconokinase [Aneurinibacillus aneurinilyticus]MED0731224.1 gluconokinase [Aneurinibacillus aneurinilyticus]MED0741852.1 gluconokinase [Aneurinibacillus aneurinilyticus]